MKIIERGELPQNKTYQTKCHRCKTVFEFEKNEAQPFNDRGEMVLVIDCPVCKHTLSVNQQVTKCNSQTTQH